MGEYVKYRNTEVKIGTCENLYYTTYEKFVEALDKNQLSKIGGNDVPSAYAEPDSGYRFRFPFPDEDKKKIGDEYEFDRGVPIKIEKAVFSDDENDKGSIELMEMHIKQQKHIHREIDGKLCLALVWYDPVKAELFRVEDDLDMKNILKSIVRYHIVGENDPQKRNFYRQIAARILKGYRMDDNKQSIKQQTAQKTKVIPLNRKHSPGKGL